MKSSKTPALWGIGDIVIVTLLISISLSFLVGHRKPQGEQFEILYNDSLLVRSSFHDTVYHFSIHKSDFAIAVTDSTVRFIESSCPHKLCVKSHAVSKPGDEIICLPNKVILRVIGKSRYNADIISR